MSKLGLGWKKNKHKLSQIIEETHTNKHIVGDKFSSLSADKLDLLKKQLNLKFQNKWSTGEEIKTNQILKSINKYKNEEIENDNIPQKSLKLINFLINIFNLYGENKSDLELTNIKNKVIFEK